MPRAGRTPGVAGTRMYWPSEVTSEAPVRSVANTSSANSSAVCSMVSPL